VRLTEPHGAAVFWRNSRDVEVFDLNGHDLDFTPAETGTYTLIIGAMNAATGSLTVTASAELAAGALTLGTPKTVTIGRPGKDARLTFTGSAGQALGVDFTAYSFGFLPFIVVYSPDGSVAVLSVTAGSAPVVSQTWERRPPHCCRRGRPLGTR
jgi:hypothetical protein